MRVTHTEMLVEFCFPLASHRVNKFLNIAQPVKIIRNIDSQEEALDCITRHFEKVHTDTEIADAQVMEVTHVP